MFVDGMSVRRFLPANPGWRVWLLSCEHLRGLSAAQVRELDPEVLMRHIVKRDIAMWAVVLAGEAQTDDDRDDDDFMVLPVTGVGWEIGGTGGTGLETDCGLHIILPADTQYREPLCVAVEGPDEYLGSSVVERGAMRRALLGFAGRLERAEHEAATTATTDDGTSNIRPLRR